jgi:SPP1 gp7 family putative phage head morphogenesis protein
MPAEEFAELQESEREYAFTVAAVAQADLVAEVYTALERAIETGSTLEDFKAEVGARLEEAWSGSAAGGRIETIFRTNVNSAYNAGRHAVFTAPAVKEARPYWRFDSIDDDLRDDECADADGTILPQDDPWWTEHIPPLHFNCRCSFTSLSEEQARDEGIDDEGPDVDAGDGFGRAPSEPGEDWDPLESERPAAVGDILGDVLGGG